MVDLLVVESRLYDRFGLVMPERLLVVMGWEDLVVFVGVGCWV